LKASAPPSARGNTVVDPETRTVSLAMTIEVQTSPTIKAIINALRSFFIQFTGESIKGMVCKVNPNEIYACVHLQY
jgi:hypothetical protein